VRSASLRAKVQCEWGAWNNHFACRPNFAKCFKPILNILSPADWVINMYWSYSSFLKCLAILHCDLLLITIHISEWRHFSDIHISQGSVATCLRRGGMEYLKTILLGKSLVSCFSTHGMKQRSDWAIQIVDTQLTAFVPDYWKSKRGNRED